MSPDLLAMETLPEVLVSQGAKDFLAGAMGGLAGVVAGHPLDTVRIRLQQPGHAESALTCFRNTVRTEGYVALFKGMSTPLFTIALQNAISFHTYKATSRAVSSWLGDGNHPDAPLPYSGVAIAGIAAGTVQSFITSPVDLIKIRLQLQTDDRHLLHRRPQPGGAAVAVGAAAASTGRPTLRGPLMVARDILRMEGVPGLFRGLPCTLLRDSPAHAVYFGTYEFVREAMAPGCRRNRGEPLVVMLAAGGLAGALSWLVVYPLDMIKSRLQAQGPRPGGDVLGQRQYAGIRDCWRRSVREEGQAVLFRGLGPTLVRAFVVNAAIFGAYETTIEYLDKL